MDRVQATGKIRKRKAETQDNERLSKRLSLLNLERNGREKLYVAVEQPSLQTPKSKPSVQEQDKDFMQVDDTKHKVYIYDLDAELSDSESDDGKVVFLPDMEKHLRQTQIPPSILANSEGELAGNKQLVLYNVPSSLTVPEEQDSVRKAIIETRARAAARREEKRIEEARNAHTETTAAVTNGEGDSRDWYHDMVNGYASSVPRGLEYMEVSPKTAHNSSPITSNSNPRVVSNRHYAQQGYQIAEPIAPVAQDFQENDPDAMDLG